MPEDEVESKSNADAEHEIHVPLSEHPFSAKKAHSAQYGVGAGLVAAVVLWAFGPAASAAVALTWHAWAFGVIPPYRPDRHMVPFTLAVVPHYALSFWLIYLPAVVMFEVIG